MVETNHLPHLISLIVNEGFYASLSDEDQEILRKAQESAQSYAREASDERIAERIREIEESGTQILSLDEETKAAMIAACEPVYEEIRKVVSEDIAAAYMGE